jgi:hypothetical protein
MRRLICPAPLFMYSLDPEPVSSCALICMRAPHIRPSSHLWPSQRLPRTYSLPHAVVLPARPQHNVAPLGPCRLPSPDRAVCHQPPVSCPDRGSSAPHTPGSCACEHLSRHRYSLSTATCLRARAPRSHHTAARARAACRPSIHGQPPPELHYRRHQDTDPSFPCNRRSPSIHQ